MEGRYEGSWSTSRNIYSPGACEVSQWESTCHASKATNLSPIPRNPETVEEEKQLHHTVL